MSRTKILFYNRKLSTKALDIFKISGASATLRQFLLRARQVAIKR
jgi:hypothetical protein